VLTLAPVTHLPDPDLLAHLATDVAQPLLAIDALGLKAAVAEHADHLSGAMGNAPGFMLLLSLVKQRCLLCSAEHKGVQYCVDN
jgi:hypothetical protein